MKQVPYLLLFIAIIALQSCQQEEKKAQVQTTKENVANVRGILPPFEGVDVPFTTFTVDVSKEQTIRTVTGTTINIPKAAFQDADGNMIEGEVEIAYREFHDATAIIASGIPMTNAEGDEYMETAGMFELNGSQNGQEIQVAEGKELEVKMASFVEGDDFDFFYFDENTNNWENKGTAAPEKNTAKYEPAKELPKLPEVPLEPKEYDEDVFTFEINIETEEYSELDVYKDIRWQYYETGEGADPKMNPELNEWSFEEDWKEIELEPSEKEPGKYHLTLRNNNKEFKTVITPTLEGKNYEEAMAFYKQKNKEYQEAKARIKEMKEKARIKEMKEKAAKEDARRVNEAELLRSFRISNFGVYNWDIWKNPTRLRISADFDYGQESQLVNNDISVFLITGSNRSVVRYDQMTYNKFSFDPNEDNFLVVVLPENKVAYFSKDDFKKLDLAKLEQDKKYTFDMKILDEPIVSFEDFYEVLDKIN